jgi:hypothetical protein
MLDLVLLVLCRLLYQLGVNKLGQARIDEATALKDHTESMLKNNVRIKDAEAVSKWYS